MYNKTMNLEAFRTLLGPGGDEVLQAAMALEPREEDFLRHFQSLSRRYARDLARAALEIAILRREAAGKFPQAERLYFTRQALEQATPTPVSAYRSKRFNSFETLVDLGCSIGGDTRSLAAHAPTLGLDRDPLRLAMAWENLRAWDPPHSVQFVQADLTNPLPLAPRPTVALFCDPARRERSRRAYSVRHYHPSLSVIQNWLPRFPALGVKISPGVDLAEIEAYPAEVEFISLNGELKEATLWFGSLHSARRRATVLPGEHTLAVETPLDGSPRLPLSEPRAYLYEPDPAVLRAGLVTDLGERLYAAQLDPAIAYLTSEQLRPTPFARTWAVEDWFPFQLKRLRAYLRDGSVDRVVVKKRGSPIQPEALIRDLRLPGEGGAGALEKTLFLTQLRGEPVVVVCSPEIKNGQDKA